MQTRVLSKQWVMALLAGASLAGCAPEPTPEPQVATSEAALRPTRAPVLTPQVSGTTRTLIGISAVDGQVAWASGTGGTYARTTDGGATWQTGVVPGAEALQFRDVEAVSADVAYLLSIGVGADSRIYKTEDGGATWTEQFRSANPEAFYDCFAFWSPTRALAFSDAVAGRFPVIRTEDGQTWQDIGDALPAAQPGEAGFASSGTCVAVQGANRAWIATGGAEKARILLTEDGGDTWEAVETPVVQGTPSSGILSVAFRDARHGMIGAGELAAPAAFADTVARTQDGGRSWSLASRPPFPGAIYGLAYAHAATAVVTGPAGAAWTADEGDTWTSLPGATGYWAVAFGTPHTGWLVGSGGRILKIEL